MNFDIEAYEEKKALVPTSGNAVVEIEKGRLASEIQAAVIMAKNYPRDETAAFASIMESCSRPSFAQIALYRYDRGGSPVEGLTIHAAKMMAQKYKNLKYGIREVERMRGKSIMEAYCWDMEANNPISRVFEVAHVRDTRKGNVTLTSERDIYEITANMASRRLRACILDCIPADIRSAAEAAVKKNMVSKERPLMDLVREMVIRFKALGITQEMLEKRLGHEIDLTTADEMRELVPIYNSINDKVANRFEFFDVPEKEDKPKRTLESLTEDE